MLNMKTMWTCEECCTLNEIYRRGCWISSLYLLMSGVVGRTRTCLVAWYDGMVVGFSSYSIQSDDGVSSIVVDQQTAGASWNLLGIYNFTQGGEYQISLTDEANGTVIADSIRLLFVIP